MFISTDIILCLRTAAHVEPQTHIVCFVVKVLKCCTTVNKRK